MTVKTEKEFEELIVDPQLANPKCITMVEVVMGRLDAPRLLQENVSASQRSTVSTASEK